VGAIAIWQRKALSQVWENVFKHEKSPSVDIPEPPSSTKQVKETIEETLEEQIPNKPKKPRASGSSGSSAGSPKSNPEPPPKASEPPPAQTATASSLPDDVEALVKTFKMDARATFEADNPGVKISLNASNMPEPSSYGIFHIIKKTGLVFPSSKFRTSSGKEYLEPFFEIENPKNVDKFGTLKVKKPAKVDSDYKVIEKGIIEICK